MKRQLFLIGGDLYGENGGPLIQKLLSLTGPAQPKIGVILETTSEQDLAWEDTYILFSNNGVVDIELIDISEQNRNTPEIVSKIKSKNILFFGGGGQERSLFGIFYSSQGRQGIVESLALRAIREGFEIGSHIIAGSSAGSMIQQGQNLIVGGQSYEALLYGSQNVLTYSQDDDSLVVDYEGGFGFFNYGIIDTHFSWRGREGRLINAAFNSAGKMGFGIDNATAMHVTIERDNASFETFGQGSVYVINCLSALRVRNEIVDVKILKISNGDSYNFNGQLTTKGTRLINGRERITSVPISNDILVSVNNSNQFGEKSNPEEFAKTSQNFILSKLNKMSCYSYESPKIEIQFIKKNDTKAFMRFKSRKIEKLTYENLYLNIILP